MKGPALQQAISAVAQTGDVTSLADHLADDVELDVAIGVCLPLSSKRVGKRAVAEQLRGLQAANARSAEDPCEFFAEGDRIVALREEQVAIGRGLAARSVCAMVFDVEGEFITRVRIHFELHPNLQSVRPHVVTARRWGERTNDDVTGKLEV